jgi:peroxiredoxin (alkyl hydroperoxide reductase subunit C)
MPDPTGQNRPTSRNRVYPPCGVKSQAKDRNLLFPLLSDFEPKGAVARAYGVYNQADGTSERALFVIDGAGVVRWSYVSPSGVNPGADGILRALDDLAVQGVAA